MITNTQIQGSVGLLKLDGRFTFEHYEEFKTATARLMEMGGIKEVHLDLSGATYMDSNALSMLLALRDRTEPKGIRIKLVKPSPSVRTILEMVQFEKLFDIVG